MDMDQPIFPAPPGYVVNLANPQRKGEAANMWVGIVGMSIAAIFMAIRIYTKSSLAKRFAPDDVALIVAWCFSITIQIIILFQYRRGTLGVHIWELSGHRVNASLNLVSVASIMYCPFLASAKLSLLLLYLRLSPIRWFRMCVYASMFIVIGYNIALFFPLVFACTPFKRNWDVSITEGHCIDRTPLYMATAVLNMVTDILLLILPIPMALKLQVPAVQKAGLLCIFGVGSLTCITSGVRLALLFPMLTTIDQTWAIVMPGIWILIEANLVIVTGCLPAMRLFFRHVAPRLIGESTSRSRTRTYGTGSHGVHSELQTIGSKHANKAYDHTDDDGVSVGSEERATAGWQADGASERGIVLSAASKGAITKTQSFRVESEVCEDEVRDAERGRVSRSSVRLR